MTVLGQISQRKQNGHKEDSRKDSKRNKLELLFPQILPHERKNSKRCTKDISWTLENRSEK